MSKVMIDDPECEKPCLLYDKVFLRSKQLVNLSAYNRRKDPLAKNETMRKLCGIDRTIIKRSLGFEYTFFGYTKNG